MTDDEQFDAWLKDAASGYNHPPATVPREAMWQAIQPRIARPAEAPALSLPHRSRPRWIPLAAAAAVLALVSYQVGRNSAPTAGPAGASSVAVPAPDGDNALYTTAATEHLGRAEALLTSLRAGTPASSTDGQVQRWARDLLADTRLLLDSPAALDPARRRLLQDLELTLAQVVQLPAAATSDDQRLVEGALRRGDLLTRIRSAVPSALSGT